MHFGLFLFPGKSHFIFDDLMYTMHDKQTKSFILNQSKHNIYKAECSIHPRAFTPPIHRAHWASTPHVKLLAKEIRFAGEMKSL